MDPALFKMSENSSFGDEGRYQLRKTQDPSYRSFFKAILRIHLYMKLQIQPF